MTYKTILGAVGTACFGYIAYESHSIVFAFLSGLTFGLSTMIDVLDILLAELAERQ
jgi:hypothetical protein